MKASRFSLRRSPLWLVAGIPYRAVTPFSMIARDFAKAAWWMVSSREDTNYTYAVTEHSLLQLSHMIALATGVQPEEVRSYFREVTEDQELKNHIIAYLRAGPDRWLADPRADIGRRVGWYAIARITKPDVIVETGVDKGMGSVVLASALLRNGSGRLYGTDIDPEQGKLLSGKYAEVGEILYGDSIESLTGFPHTIDLFINDSDHSADYEYREYQTVADKLSERAIIIADNAHATDCARRFSEETGRSFVFWREQPKDHWYPGAGIGLSYPKRENITAG